MDQHFIPCLDLANH